MEIERKYLIEKEQLPKNLSDYPFHRIEQGYLCTSPVVRIRRQDDEYFLTYKSKGLMAREEYNLPLTKEAYEHLLSKIDGRLIKKKLTCFLSENLPTTLSVLPSNLISSKAILRHCCWQKLSSRMNRLPILSSHLPGLEKT